jgi:hypothetical protein
MTGPAVPQSIAIHDMRFDSTTLESSLAISKVPVTSRKHIGGVEQILVVRAAHSSRPNFSLGALVEPHVLEDIYSANAECECCHR